MFWPRAQKRPLRNLLPNKKTDPKTSSRRCPPPSPHDPAALTSPAFSSQRLHAGIVPAAINGRRGASGTAVCPAPRGPRGGQLRRVRAPFLHARLRTITISLLGRHQKPGETRSVAGGGFYLNKDKEKCPRPLSSVDRWSISGCPTYSPSLRRRQPGSLFSFFPALALILAPIYSIAARKKPPLPDSLSKMGLLLCDLS